MSAKAPTTAELVPLADRYRWMVACRVLMAISLLTLPLAGAPGMATPWLVATIVLWTSVTAASGGLIRSSRGLSVTIFGVSLLGDGIMLILAQHHSGVLEQVVAALILLHIVAVTLLGSFRTGVKIAIWHSVLALLYFEVRKADLIAAPAGTVAQLAVSLAVVWLVTLATATAAAISERELRRRRYDSEVLRHFALALSEHRPPATVVTMLATFAHEELGAHRAAVLAYPESLDGRPAERGYATTVDAAGVRLITELSPEIDRDALLRRAIDNPAALTMAQLDREANPHLAAVLTDHQNLIIVPFALEQVTGLLVLQFQRRFSSALATRVERRVVTAAEQAAQNTAIALGRSLLHERVRDAAQRDGLTGIPNRRTFNEALARAVGDDGPFALVMIDLDKFKVLNDEHGHQTGDDVLKLAARAITGAVRDTDLAARYGGEEFAAILQPADTADAVAIAERIRLAVAGADTPVPVTASLGVAAVPAHAADAIGLIAAADAALYRAKRGGRNQVQVAAAQVAGPQRRHTEAATV